MFKDLIAKDFQIEFHSHAEAILRTDFPEALKELEQALSGLIIPIDEIIGSGGGETKGTQRLRRSLAGLKWSKVNFEIRKTINGIERESISHEVDHVRVFDRDQHKYMIALEIEWNNKDPFFDRDLENFKRLHAEGAISVGIVVTRGSSLQDDMKQLIGRFVEQRQINSFQDLERYGIRPTPRQEESVNKRVKREVNSLSFKDAWVDMFVSDKFGAATTHWRKLQDRVHRGVGNPCPLLMIGLPSSIVSFDQD